MPEAFFASTRKKRKRPPQSSATAKNSARPRKAPRRDEELDSDATHSDIADLDLRASDVDSGESDREENPNETPAAKRLRLAKIYLDSVKEGLTVAEGEYDAAEIDREIISARLKEDVLENAGKLHIFIAGSIIVEDPPPSRLRVKGHRMAVTSALISHDASRVYMAGKEGGISCNDVASGKQLSYAPKLRRQGSTSNGIGGKGKGKKKGNTPASELSGHSDEVLALALSGDGKYLVSGGKDRTVGVWDVIGLAWVKGFVGHKDTISALSFRKSTNMLYSASSDRTLKLFDLSPGVMGYVETLFGHQDSVTGLDSLRGDTAVSCGGRDRTVRFWKIADETQLVFRGGGAGSSKARDILDGVLDEDEGVEMYESSRKGKGKGKGKDKEKWVEGSVDCVAMVDEQTFLSGGDSGSIALWSINKKKPTFTFATAHGLDEMESSTEGKLRRPRWIVSLACLRYSDLFASGSWDGRIRLWKLEPSLRSFSPVGSLDAPGLVNSLQLIAMPKAWASDKEWSADTRKTSKDTTNTDATNGVSPPILTNGVGKEPRLGRWIRLKEDGIVNSALIFALRTRKATG
ncbi:WD40-repeat-containing domain protein [Gautieria morchelliformis]|nr:WD40-repeat-containing domain protein [Gautieria morchelliformis]